MSCEHVVNYERIATKQNSEECALCYEKTDLKGCLTCGHGFCTRHMAMHSKNFISHSLFVTNISEKCFDRANREQTEAVVVHCVKCECDVFSELPIEIKEIASNWKNHALTPNNGAEFYAPNVHGECPHRNPSGDTLTMHSTSDCCLDCQTRYNLWICLACGYTSCGREELGGNGHAKHHASQTGHSVAVRCETLSTLNQEETWCYECDDMIKYKNLGERLEELGVHFPSPRKKSKTLHEMEQDSYKSIVSEDAPSIYLKAKGISNVGNSCYMGSALQLLLSSHGIISVFGGSDTLKMHLESSTNHPFESTCKICQLAKITAGLCTDSNARHLSPYFFKEAWCKDTIFETTEQQDVDEFLCFLLENLSQLEKSTPLIPSSHFRSHFEICVLHTAQCTSCNHITFREEWQWTLHLSLPQHVFDQEISEESSPASVRIQECLDATFVPTTEQLRCPSCESIQDMHQKKSILQFPQCLFAYVQKYYWDSKSMCIQKAKVDIHCDSLLDDSITLFDKLKTASVLSESELACFRSNKLAKYHAQQEKHQQALARLRTQDHSIERIDDALARFDTDAAKALVYLDEHPAEPASSTLNTTSLAASTTVAYKPFGYVVHYGSNAYSGHYVAYRRSEEGWLELNDEDVTIQSHFHMDKACLYAFIR